MQATTAAVLLTKHAWSQKSIGMKWLTPSAGALALASEPASLLDDRNQLPRPRGIEVV